MTTQPPTNLPFDPSDVEGLDLGPSDASNSVPPVSLPKDVFSVPPPPPSPIASTPASAPLSPPPVPLPQSSTPTNSSAPAIPPAPAISVMPKPTSQPVDIFADSKEVQKPTPAPTRVLPPLPSSGASSTLKYVAIGFGGLVLCVGVAFAGWKLFSAQSANTSPKALVPTTPTVTTPKPEVPVAPSLDQTATTEMPTNTSSTGIVIPEPVTSPPAGTNIPLPTEVTTTATPVPDPTIDSDADRLTDVREIQLGTDPQKNDSDSDGLSDGDEILKYGTNPLNPDTDGDGYQDGSEVSKGYDPRGSGKCATATCTVP